MIFENSWHVVSFAGQATVRFVLSTPVRSTGLRAGQDEMEPCNTTSRFAQHEKLIVALPQDKTEISFDEMVAWLAEERAIAIDRSMLSKLLRSRGFTNKNRPHTH